MRIGVFDSGLGGVNVLSCLRKKYPNNDYVYFGDTKNLPYGDKSIDELNKLAREAINFLLTKDVEIIIIACGTVSSTCYNKLKEEYSIPIYDIITPTIEYIKDSNLDKIGVIGTKRTIESNVFNIPNKHILMKATPSFVPIIENSQIEEKQEEIINELTDFVDSDILILGCTHYPSLKEVINTMNIKTLDMGEILTNKINIPNDGNGTCELYFSKISIRLIVNINRILGDNFKIYTK
jgi:glutamate racemase